MLHRLLDVVFQHLVVLVAVLVVLPSAVFAVGAVLDRSQLVTARLWADEPAVLSGSPYAGQSDGHSPAQHQSDLLAELLQTDSFVSTVMGLANVSATGSTSVQDFGDDLRKNLTVTPEGPHVMLVDYQTKKGDQGVKVVKAVITAFEQAQVGVQTGQVTVADEALSAQLKTAKKEMDDALSAAAQYQASHDQTTLATDPTFQSLRTLASVKVSSYSNIVKLADSASQYQSAIPSVQTTVLKTVDPPQASSASIDLKGPATKNAMYVLAALFALELAFVYNVTRRDQRVRTAHEVVASLGLISLGTVPHPGGRAR